MNEDVRGYLYDPRVRWGIIAVIFLLALFLAVKTLAEVKEIRYIGGGVPANNTVTVTGEGEAFAVPDVATFSVGVIKEAETASEAQEAVTEKMNAITSYLKEQGIEDKDIKTVGYNVYPRYDYIQDICTAGRCTPGRQVLAGFEASQTVEVKVRDTEKAGNLLSGVSEAGANNVSGLSFTIDEPDQVQSEARAKAIEDAEAKAEQLADELGVRLVRVVSFNESGEPPYYPLYYDGKEAFGRGGASDMAVAQSAPAANVAPGENKIISRVSITYEIR